jgi:hypothetical protein
MEGIKLDRLKMGFAARPSVFGQDVSLTIVAVSTAAPQKIKDANSSNEHPSHIAHTAGSGTRYPDEGFLVNAAGVW